MVFGIKFTLGPVLLFCLAFLPPFFLGILIYQYSVDVPYWDQWEIALFFERFAQGSLSLNDLFAQQNEYRQFFPNLIFLGLGWLTSWNVRYEMLVSFMLACFASYNIYRLSQVTFYGDDIRRALMFIIANVFIFSPIQYENWLFGVQIIYFIPIACITTCLLIAYSRMKTR